MSSPLRSSIPRIIVPALLDTDLNSITDLAARLAGPTAEVLLLGVVQVTHADQLTEAAASARLLRARLARVAARLARDQPREVLVRAADTIQAGIQQAIVENPGVLLVGLPAGADAGTFQAQPYAELLANPAADTVFVRPGKARAVQSIMLSARGGPHAVLALDLAGRLGRSYGAGITLVHVDAAGTNSLRRQGEQQLFHELLARAADGGKVRTASLAGSDVEATIIGEARRHDLLIVGTHVGLPQSAAVLGAVPEAALAESELPLLIVRSRGPVSPALFRRQGRGLDDLVSAWFVDNTSRCREYSDLEQLMAVRRRRGISIAAVVLEGGSSDSLPAYGRVLSAELQHGVPLLDDALYACSDLSDSVPSGGGSGLRVLRLEGCPPGDRGRLMHAALRRLSADIVVWLDADTLNAHAKLVYGLVGPLLLHPHLRCVKGYFSSTRGTPEADLRTLVGELSARPLIDLYLPELAGFVSPMTLEHACWREDALQLPFSSGASAHLGQLVDSVEQLGLSAVAQVGLDEQVALPMSLPDATRLAISAARELIRRVGPALEEPLEAVGGSFRQLRQIDGRLELAVSEAHEAELSPGLPAGTGR